MEFLAPSAPTENVEFVEREVRLLDIRAKHDSIIADHREQIVHHVNLEMYGKQIDKPDVYTKYLVAKCKIYFDTHAIHDERVKLELMNHALTKHVQYKVTREVPAFTSSIESIRAANRYNLMSSGVRIHYPWYNFYRATKERIFQDPENQEAGYVEYEQPNFWKYGAIALVLAIGAWKGRQHISRLLSIQTPGTITQYPAKALEQLSLSVTSLKEQLNTTDMLVAKHLSILNTSWFERALGHVTDTCKEYYQQLDNAFTKSI
jgi:hypothetical protein